ncbi:hypothetical protein E1H12_15065 [Geitlerinema sp. P-1104]|uniref:hypothetical protein n=1 Tax=Geitlerinema sp. P-1104 TaxID=2546230 RepID=UPI0014771B99|nr:hypothetical protein [Geitlerinema sp. P-1104]NMG59801.1 hypothetical protein [Geitlerinema sp. P-1104]
MNPGHLRTLPQSSLGVRGMAEVCKELAMNAHHRDRPSQPGDRQANAASENIHEIIVGVLIASFTLAAIPILRLESLSNSPNPSVVVPSEATLWSDSAK